jgi:hypothetical protein
MRKEIFVVAALVLVIAGIAVTSYMKGHPKGEPTPPCVAGANERCPSDEWLKSYEEFQAAQEKLKQDMKSDGITDRQRTLAGWAQDLGKGIPTQEGYSFDEKTKKFTKPAITPLTPMPTPQAEPKKP